MKVRHLERNTIVKLKDGTICKILKVKYRPTVKIIARDTDKKEIRISFKDIEKVLFESTTVEKIAEHIPLIFSIIPTLIYMSLLVHNAEKMSDKLKELVEENNENMEVTK